MADQNVTLCVKRRGRPPKNPEGVIQDKKAYMREWYHAHKDDENVRSQTRQIKNDKIKRIRELYTLIKDMILNGELVVAEQHLIKIKHLTCCE